ncbi:Glutamate synthase [NADPH] small chain [compost metagenome]
MPEQPPVVRARNFEEVALEYTPQQAMEEAERCMQCKHKPCVNGCPVGVPIAQFIHAVAAGEFEQAYRTITAENSLPAICGRGVKLRGGSREAWLRSDDLRGAACARRGADVRHSRIPPAEVAGGGRD